jgi:uncharacterized membrane protein
VRIVEAVEIAAPPEGVWELLGDPERYLHFMSGFTRWEVVSDNPTGEGARYRMLLRVGSAEVGGLVEVVEWNEPREIAWNSITGIDQRGRWRVRSRDRGRTRVELRLSYGIAGAGVLGVVAERIAAPTVRGHLRRTLRALKRQVEHEQLRKNAAARRRAREARPAA